VQRLGPDFLGIGAQKAATTWVFKWLKAHPEIGFAPMDKQPRETIADGKVTSTWPKELHFIVGPNNSLGWDWYLDLFDHSARTERVLGEICPRYLIAPPEAIDTLKARCPDVRLLLNLRDPVERDWSAIRMIARRRNVLDQPAELKQIANLREIVEKGGLRPHVERWMDRFDRSQFFVSTVAGIEANPLATIKSIARFLGIDDSHYDRPNVSRRLAAPVHKGQEMAIPQELEEMLWERHRETYGVLKEIKPDITR